MRWGYFKSVFVSYNLLCASHELCQKNLNLCIKTEPVTAGMDARFMCEYSICTVHCPCLGVRVYGQ